jgi:hypothetical protein
MTIQSEAPTLVCVDEPCQDALCPVHGDGRDTSIGAPKLADLSVDELWAEREEAKKDKDAAASKMTACDAEADRRIHVQRPDFGPETGGGAEIVGEELRLVMTYSREYEDDERVLLDLLQRRLLTPEEFSQLVKYEPKVNGTTYNALLKRGGEVEEILRRARTLKSSRPSFAAKPRAV